MDDHKEVNVIDISVIHTLEESCYNNPLDRYLAHFGQNFDIDEFIDAVNALLDFVPIIDTNKWKTKVESLPVSTSVPILSIMEPPKLELKPLLDTLKYVFLGDFETLPLPMINFSHLDKDQERKLLDVLCGQKEAIG